MRHPFRTSITIVFVGIAACLTLSVRTPSFAQQGGAPAAGRGGARGGGGGFTQSNDPRVQNRTYHFADTNVDLPYCVFVSSKVAKDKKNPLIISLHGLGIGPGYMCQGKAIDLAEEGGYILAAVFGTTQ